MAVSHTGAGADTTTMEEKKQDAVKPQGTYDIESVAAEPEKGHFSKVSVWLMILFSGLAIGSDG